MGSHFIEGGARCGKPVARPWGVGRGQPILPREHSARGAARTDRTKELTGEVFVGRQRAAQRIALKLRATRALAQGCGTTVGARQGANTPFPLKRSPPASFKRLLGSGILAKGVRWSMKKGCYDEEDAHRDVQDSDAAATQEPFT